MSTPDLFMPSQIRLVPVGELQPYANNARLHSDAQVEQVMASIQRWGWTNPCLVANGELLAGHCRLMAAKRLGLARVPCIDVSHLPPEDRRALIIADNQLALNATWDLGMLRIEIGALADGGFDVGLLGFDGAFLDGLLSPEPSAGLTDPDDAPEIPPDPVTRQGDLWVLGQHRLLCGDSTDLAAVQRLMDGGLADVLITDPPYNVNYEGSTKAKLKIKNDSMQDGQFRQFLRDAFVAADAVMKPGAVFYVWHADSEGFNFRGACRDAGWQVRQCLIWEKDSLVLGRQDYHWVHEPCLYGWKNGASHLWAADRKQTTILKFERPKRNDVHPTMKPVALIEYQLLNNTKGGDLLLDAFAGSGTAVIAAEKSGRVARVMELDPRYCDVIITRWQAYTGRAATLHPDGPTFELVKGERLPATA